MTLSLERVIFIYEGFDACNNLNRVHMLVKDLIKELKKFDMDMEVYTFDDDWNTPNEIETPRLYDDDGEIIILL